MKITYISHATLLIEIDGIKILTDPWVTGSAYCDQWYLFPKPVENAIDLLKDVQYVLISHGHEDHLHGETLRHVNKDAHIFFPYTWYEGAVGFFKELGFQKITEAVNEKQYTLSKNITITFLANNLDNVVIIEANNKVLVNINDALPSAPQGIISYFIKKIRSKWPTVQYLFSSYGGASYFPNTIKCEWKNDLETGIVREQFFLDNFCKIAKGINAKFSIPFASDFVLLDDDQRWINKVKFSRSAIKKYFTDHFSDERSNTQIKIIYPGDIIENENFSPLSSYHEKFKYANISTLSEQEYQEVINKKRDVKTITHAAFENLYHKVKDHVHKKYYIVPEEKRDQLKFALKITDAGNEPYIEIDLRENRPSLKLIDSLSDHVLLLKVKSQTILYSISNEWGGDAIIIGYGCEINIFSMETIRQQLENYAIQLLTNYPNTKEYIKKNPLRSFNYLAHDKIKRKIFLNKITGKKISVSPFADERLGDKELWLTRSNCEICRKCNLPVLTNEDTNFLT